MTAAPAPQVQNLFDVFRQIKDLEVASAVLQWDQETMMPNGGQSGRGQVLSTLTGLKHDLLTSARFGDAIDACAEAAEDCDAVAAQVREAKRRRDHAVRVPSELAQQLAQAESNGLVAWQRARKADDFKLFRDELKLLIDLVKQKADALTDDGDPYDSLLDLFDPGCSSSELTPMFAELRAELAPLVQAVADCGKVVDETPAQGDFPWQQQLAFGQLVATQMGFDFEHGRLDLAAHPFCTSFYASDVRLTWRYDENDIRPALFGIMHEAGHGLYEQGLPPHMQGTPAGDAVGMGVHESQSRMWENLVGRSKEFWQWAMPKFVEHFPGKDGLAIEQLYPALHKVKPTLIRVEADEATYNLHIAARYEIEKAIIAGQVEVDELPELWNQTYLELLGIRPESDANGILQDIHWSMGAFGYFPSYTLGNLINSQLFEAAKRDIPNMNDQFANGEFQPLLQWLRENVHAHGSRFQSSELVKLATGEPMSSSAFLSYIREVTHEVYGIGVPRV
jgi:carboxypeptidase Taq